jgi:hypothetical protein
MNASDGITPKQPTSTGVPTEPLVRPAEEPEFWSPGSLALAIVSIILGMLFGVAAVVLGVSGGWPGVPPLILSVAFFSVASRQIKKNEPVSSP